LLDKNENDLSKADNKNILQNTLSKQQRVTERYDNEHVSSLVRQATPTQPTLAEHGKRSLSPVGVAYGP